MCNGRCNGSIGTKGLDRPLQVEQFRVGVNLHGQADVRMPHQLLSDAWGNTGPGQHRPKRHSQAVDIDDKAPIVPVSDSSSLAVGVKAADQGCRNVEHTVIRSASCDAKAQRGHQIGPQWDDAVLAVLDNCSGQPDDGDRSIKVQIGDLQLPDFADPQSRSHQEGVQVGPVAS
jgi:hypothetical protein